MRIEFVRRRTAGDRSSVNRPWIRGVRSTDPDPRSRLPWRRNRWCRPSPRCRRPRFVAAIEILNHAPTPGLLPESIDAKNESKLPPAEQSGRTVRHSYYLAMEQFDSQEAPVPSEDEVRRATFRPPTPAVTELDLPSEPSVIRFGMPRIIPAALPSDLLVLQGNTSPPAIAPFILRDPTTPIVMAAMKARLRRPQFLDSPITQDSLAAKQVDAIAFAPDGNVEIVQYDPRRVCQQRFCCLSLSRWPHQHSRRTGQRSGTSPANHRYRHADETTAAGWDRRSLEP